jgi:endopeptidase La
VSSTLPDHALPLFTHTHPIFPNEKVAIKITKSVIKRYQISVGQPLLLAYWLDKKHLRIDAKHLHAVATLVDIKKMSLLGDFYKVEIQGKQRVAFIEVCGSHISPYACYQELYSDPVPQQEQVIKVKRELLVDTLKSHQFTLPRNLQTIFDQTTFSYETWMLTVNKQLNLTSSELMNVFQTIELEDLFKKTQDLLSNFLIEKSLKDRFIDDSMQQFTYQRQKHLMVRRIQDLKSSIRLLDQMHRSEQKQKHKTTQEEIERISSKTRILPTTPRLPYDKKLDRTGKSTAEITPASDRDTAYPVIELSPQEQARIDEILKEWEALKQSSTLEEDDFEEDYDDSWDEEPIKDNVEERIRALPLTAEAKAEVKRVLHQQNSGTLIGPELHNIRSFLEVVADLPWEKRAALKAFDLNLLQSDLDQEHYGLKEVKSRMIEFLAASTLSPKPMGSTLCLIGPPGVGKTSLIKVIAQSLGRPFVRISLGGVQDEADIRGHRRTYVSATPGRICDALKKAKVKNPIILLDEVDKMASGVRGDPAAALLEVLDPEQNHSFRDHYLEIPLDLSEVLFICTANDARGMSAPLRDRLEMLELSGYTHNEKVHIAQKYLIQRQLRKHGLPINALTFSPAALNAVILEYCKEAGVRQLERKLARICRKMAVSTLQSRAEQDIKQDHKKSDDIYDELDLFVQWHLDDKDLLPHLGAAPYNKSQRNRKAQKGLAYGLAWTAVGGSVLKIETACLLGKGQIKMTGRMGDVMKESVEIAFTALRVHHQEKIDQYLEKPLSELDIHIHLPEGATPKDGPSAGVTLYCALYSLLTGEILNPHAAMTGECTLQGQILAVGGLKEKLLAAQQDEMKMVILPQANQAMVMDFEEDIRGDLVLHWVDTAEKALHVMLQSAT